MAEYEKILSQSGDVLDDGERKSIEELCKRYRFFIETSTIDTDYLNSQPLRDKTQTRENAGFMFYFERLSSLFMWALAIAAAAYLFLFDYHTLAMKNIFGAQIKRKNIFMGKLCLLFVFSLAVFTLFTLFALSFGLTQRQVKLFVCHNGAYRAISAIAAFLTQASASFTVMTVFISITLFGGIILRNLVIGIITPVIVYGLILLMTFTYETFTFSPHDGLLTKLPFLSLQFHVGGMDLAFLACIAGHLIFAAAILFLTKRLFCKQDF